MVMYESAGDTLSLVFENTPSSQEVVNAILNAPIEYGETFQNKKKGRTFTKENYVNVVADGLGKKAIEAITSDESLKKAGFSLISALKFSVPEAPVSEQVSLMR